MRSPAGRGRAYRPLTYTLRHRPNHRGLTLGSVTHTFQAATTADAQFVHDEWDRRTRAHDIDGLIDLYLADATLESPLVPRVLDQRSGVPRGNKSTWSRSWSWLVPASRAIASTGAGTERPCSSALLTRKLTERHHHERVRQLHAVRLRSQRLRPSTRPRCAW
jgi:hypothetical protein